MSDEVLEITFKVPRRKPSEDDLLEDWKPATGSFGSIKIKHTNHFFDQTEIILPRVKYGLKLNFIPPKL